MNIKNIIITESKQILPTQTNMSAQIRLSVSKTNKFGDTQYVQDDNGSITTLDPTKFWTIKHPSEQVISSLLAEITGCGVYTCSSGQYLLSPKAFNVIKPEGDGCGSAIRIQFTDLNAMKWCLMMADNKPYLQHVQGAVNGSENAEACIIREVQEETRIDLSNKFSLVQWAEYSFLGGNDLIDCFWPAKTTVFFVKLTWKEVAHLFPHGLISDLINIVNVKDYPFVLDETRFIVAVPEQSSSVAPTKIDQIKVTKQVSGKPVEVPLEFGNHHRALYDCFYSSDAAPKFPFLHTFEIFLRAKDIPNTN